MELDTVLNDHMKQIQRQSDLVKAITNAMLIWVEKNGQFNEDDQMYYSGILDQTSDRMVTNAIHRLRGRYRGCGF